MLISTRAPSRCAVMRLPRETWNRTAAGPAATIGAWTTIGPSAVTVKICAKPRATAQSRIAASLSNRKALLGCIASLAAFLRRGVALAAAAPFAPPLLAHALGVLLRLLFLDRAARRGRLVERHVVAEHFLETELLETLGKVCRQLCPHVDRGVIGMVDAQPPGMEVHLAADPAGQEGRLAAIFAVTDDRVSDRRHVHAQLVGAAGVGAQLDPGSLVAGALDHTVAGAGRLTLRLVDMHLLAAAAGLLGDRQLDHAVLDRR